VAKKMGAASTVPLEVSKEPVLDEMAQPKELPVATNKIQDRENSTVRNAKNEISERSDDSKGTMKRKYSLELMMPHSLRFHEESFRGGWPDSIGNGRVEVGDVVRVPMTNGSTVDGLVLEIISTNKIIVDCGDISREVNPEECELITKVMDFEEGDKVEVKPADCQLYFVGKVIKIHADKTMDVLMDGDDPEDIEYKISPENTRKLMSRRALVINRWKRAFMLVLATNFFRRIHFYPRSESKQNESIHATDVSGEK
jgi:hypothetical protein